MLRNSNPPAFVGIDEIDANLHPRMQVILADIVKEAAQKNANCCYHSQS
jgi:predicted ATPase